MYKILQSQIDSEANIEARLAQVENGYSVGIWDLDAKEYYPGMKIFPFTLEQALEMAESLYQKITGESQ